ncbi:hypothetical protein [Streptomyces sp. NPDC050848]
MTWPQLIAYACAITTAVLIHRDQHRPSATTPPQDPPDGDQP